MFWLNQSGETVIWLLVTWSWSPAGVYPDAIATIWVVDRGGASRNVVPAPLMPRVMSTVVDWVKEMTAGETDSPSVL